MPEGKEKKLEKAVRILKPLRVNELGTPEWINPSSSKSQSS
jgi:hypothetical protein